jgi:integrase/recombinase XerD
LSRTAPELGGAVNAASLLRAEPAARPRGRSLARSKVSWIHWQSGTAQLLPRLLRGREAGPVFITNRQAPARTPALDACPITGRARLSYRRAAELFTEVTRDLDPAGAGWTPHQLRHSDLTHEAEEGASTPMLLARSRHASVRSLERYARPGVDAVGAYVARRDPAARRRHAGFRPGV